MGGAQEQVRIGTVSTGGDTARLVQVTRDDNERRGGYRLLFHLRARALAAVEIGPIDTPPIGARLRRFDIDRIHVTSSEWRVTLEVDLDGNRQPDLEWVTRCKHWISSPCAGKWCMETCSATRMARRPPGEVFDVDCGDGIPDVPDCEPTVR